MIDVKITSAGVERMVFAGDLDDVTAEILYEINAIYSGLCKSSEAGAKEFRRKFVMAVVDPDYGVWDAREDAQGIFMAQEKKE